MTTGGLFFHGFWHKAIDGDFKIPGYFGSTIIIILFVRTLPPYTQNRWLV